MDEQTHLRTRSLLVARHQHPAWKLLSATRGPLVLSCLQTLIQQHHEEILLEDAQQMLTDIHRIPLVTLIRAQNVFSRLPQKIGWAPGNASVEGSLSESPPQAANTHEKVSTATDFILTLQSLLTLSFKK